MLLILAFFVVAMGFSIYCWHKHDGLLGLLSFLLWFLFVVFSFGQSLAPWDLYYDFGLFGSLMGIIAVFTSLFMIIQKQKLVGEDDEDIPPEDYLDSITKHRKAIHDKWKKIRGYE